MNELSYGSRQFANGLGWLSVGLGVSEIAAPAAIAALAGIKPATTLTRALGVREVLNGVAILVTKRKAPFLWSRVIGDVIDLALLFRAGRSKRSRFTGAVATVASITVLDVLASVICSRSDPHGPYEVQTSIIVNRSLDECYAFCNGLGAPIVAEMKAMSFESTLSGRATLVRLEDNGIAAKQALRELKQILETGEVATAHGQPTGTRSLLGRVVAKGLEP